MTGRKLIVWTCLALCLCLPLVVGAQRKAEGNSQAIVIRGKWIWDGTGNPAIPDGVILIQEDRIVAVGTEKEVRVPRNSVSIDQRDLFLMPGLVDAHEHYAMDQFAGVTELELTERSAAHLAFRAARNGRTALRSGVTTAIIASEVTKYSKEYLDVEYKRAFDEDLVPGPRIVPGGNKIRAPDGYPNYPALGPAPSGVDEVRRFVRNNFRAGAGLCKMFISGFGHVVEPGTAPTVREAIYFTNEEIQAIVEECHRHGKKVTAHVIKGGPSFEWAIAAGVDSFEHPVMLTPEEWRKIKDHNIVAVIGMSRWFVPGGFFGIAPLPDGEEILRNWYKLAFASGAKLALGADGFQDTGAMAKEVAVLVLFGMTNEQALLVATRNGGELSGLPVGTLEPGKYADVIGIRGNPLEDINALQQVGFVMKGGKVYNLSEQ